MHCKILLLVLLIPSCIGITSVTKGDLFFISADPGTSHLGTCGEAPAFADRLIPVANSGCGSCSEMSGNTVAVAAGMQFTLVLTENGNVFAFGKSDNGALGDSTLVHTCPTKITNPAIAGHATDVVVGTETAYILTDDGKVWIAGPGDATTAMVTAIIWSGNDPTYWPTVDGYRSTVNYGTKTSWHLSGPSVSAVDSNSNAFVWSNEEYMRGRGGAPPTTHSGNYFGGTLDNPAFNGKVRQVVSSAFFGSLLTDDGDIYMWGVIRMGQTELLTPTLVTAPELTGKTVVTLAVSMFSLFALTDSGEVYRIIHESSALHYSSSLVNGITTSIRADQHALQCITNNNDLVLITDNGSTATYTVMDSPYVAGRVIGSAGTPEIGLFIIAARGACEPLTDAHGVWDCTDAAELNSICTLTPYTGSYIIEDPTTGTHAATCDGTNWTGGFGAKAAVLCSATAPVVANGEWFCEGTLYGDSCNLQCAPGYDLVLSGNDVRLTCGYDGKRVGGTDAACTVRNCGALPSAPPHGKFLCNSDNTVCKVGCEDGYLASTEFPTAICQADGNWAGDALTTFCRACSGWAEIATDHNAVNGLISGGPKSTVAGQYWFLGDFPHQPDLCGAACYNQPGCVAWAHVDSGAWADQCYGLTATAAAANVWEPASGIVSGRIRQPCQVLPAQVSIADPGYGGSCPRGYYDVLGQGVCNDYCRWVGNGGCQGDTAPEPSHWSCALAGSADQNTPPGQIGEADFPVCGSQGAPALKDQETEINSNHLTKLEGTTSQHTTEVGGVVRGKGASASSLASIAIFVVMGTVIVVLAVLLAKAKNKNNGLLVPAATTSSYCPTGSPPSTPPIEESGKVVEA